MHSLNINENFQFDRTSEHFNDLLRHQFNEKPTAQVEYEIPIKLVFFFLFKFL